MISEAAKKQIDMTIKNKFGDKVSLVSDYGPVQMGVFGLTYLYSDAYPNSNLRYKIIVESERGIFTLRVENEEDKVFWPETIYPEADCYHYADEKKDIDNLVDLTYQALEKHEIVFE